MIRLTPPTKRRYVSSGWGAPRAYRGGWHAGLDFPDKKGAPMLAAAPGVVAFVKNYSDSYAGKYSVIHHGGGIHTRYLHADENYVKVGDQVDRGDQIGTVGTTGTKSSGAHVHFDVKMLPAAFSEYQEKFGIPTTGFSAATRWGKGVPVEALMDNATYRPGVIADSKKRGVKFYKPEVTKWLLWGAVAIAGGLLIGKLIKPRRDKIFPRLGI